MGPVGQIGTQGLRGEPGNSGPPGMRVRGTFSILLQIIQDCLLHKDFRKFNKINL